MNFLASPEDPANDLSARARLFLMVILSHERGKKIRAQGKEEGRERRGKGGEKGR